MLEELRHRLTGKTPYTPDAATPQNPVYLPGAPVKLVNYLYNAGFFGTGHEAEQRQGEALNLAAMVRAIGRPAPSMEETQQLRALVAALPPEQKQANSRLLKLLDQPPSIERALEWTEKAGSGVDRILAAVSFGRLGNARRAAREWADIVGLQQASYALKAAGEAGLSNRNGYHDRQAEYERLAGITNAPTADGHFLQSALYTLRTPEMFLGVVRDHQDLLEDVPEILERARREPGGQHRSIAFGEVLAASGLLKDQRGESLPYTYARTVIDSLQLQKNADRIRLVADAIPPSLSPDHIQAESLRETSQLLHDTAEALAKQTQPRHGMPRNATGEHDIRLDPDAPAPLQELVTAMREARKSLSIAGFSLAEETARMADYLNNSGQLRPEEQEKLLSVVRELAERLQGFRELAEQTSVNAQRLTETAMQAIAQEPLLSANTTLPRIAGGYGEQLQQRYADRLPGNDIAQLHQDQQQLRQRADQGDYRPARPATPDNAVTQATAQEAVNIERQGELTATTAQEAQQSPEPARAA